MTLEVGLVLGIIGVTMVLFTIEKIAPDVIALGVIVIIVVSGLLPLDRALAGIGSEAFILILGLLVMTAGLEKTGVVDMAGDWIVRKSGHDANRFLLFIMLAAAGLSALMSNTGRDCFFLACGDRDGEKYENFSFKTAHAAGLRQYFGEFGNADSNYNKYCCERGDGR